MATIKQRRITKLIREFVKAGDSYDITGIDLSLSKFFWRQTQELFNDLATGDYRVDTANGKQTLVITNQEILAIAEAFQVGYVLDFKATQYDVQWNVDINTLKDRYNQLVEDTADLWEYIRKTGIISDDTTIDLILPQLDINEVWVRGENGYAAMPIDDVKVSIKKAIEKYLIEVVYPKIDNYVETVSKPDIDNFTEANKVEIDQFTEANKVEIDDLTEVKKGELQALKDILAAQLQELVDNALADRGVIPNGTDWNTLSYGTWYVADLNGSNYTNHPTLDNDENVGIVLVTDSEGGNAKVVRYYSMKKRMHFKIKNATGIWSEWSTLSAGSGVRYEYTQVDHGFLFTPVMLDGFNNKWVKATTNGADGVAVYIDKDRFELVMNGSVQIPSSARDSKGAVFVADEYYFLSNDVSGGLDRIKPISIFQPIMRTYIDEQSRMWAEVEVDTPMDLVPRILTEEVGALGFQMQEDVRLQTESKSITGAINENKSRIDGVEVEVSRRMNCEDTIEDLKNSTQYVVGDVVEVLGYYTKGDGAGHPRIKKPTGYTGADAVIGTDGSIWGIVHSGEVNVSWFGAKGDGVTDDISVFLKLQTLEGLTVNLENKTYFVSHPVDGDTSADYKQRGVYKIPNNTTLVNNATFVVKPNSREHNNIISTHGASNIRIEGKITIVGERDNHTFDSSSSDEWNFGLYIGYCNNIWINEIETKKHTGDGCLIEYADEVFINKITSTDNRRNNISVIKASKLEVNYMIVERAGGVGGTDPQAGLDIEPNTINEAFEDITIHNFTSKNNTTRGLMVYMPREITEPQIFNFGNMYIESEAKGIGFYKVGNNPFYLKCKNITFKGCVEEINTQLGEFYLETDIYNSEKCTGTKNIELYSGSIITNTFNYDSSKETTLCNKGLFVKDKLFVKDVVPKNYNLAYDINFEEGITYSGKYKIIKSSTPIRINDYSYSFIDVDCNLEFFSEGGELKNKITWIVKNSKGTLNLKSLYDYSVSKPINLTYNGKKISNSNIDTTSVLLRITRLSKYDFLVEDLILGETLLNIYSLDTPYHASNMQKRGILDSYHQYLTDLHEYEKQQNTQSDSEIMALNVLQPPVIPTEVEEYAKEYNLF